MSTQSSVCSCREISATGRCKHREKCQPAHDIVQVEKASPLELSTTSVQLGKRNMTLKTGHSAKGERCHWNHVIEDVQGSSPNNTNGVRNINDKNDAGSDRRNTRESRLRTKRGEQCAATEDELGVERQAREAQLLAERKMKQLEVEAGNILRRVVMDGSTLVTCCAGLDIQHIVCGFDSCFVTVKNLPRNVKRHEIEDLITEQGIDATFFCVVNMRHGNDDTEAMVMSDFGNGRDIAANLDGIQFQDKFLDTTINSGCGALNKMGAVSEQEVNVLTITWKLPTVTMMAHYTTADDAQNAVRKLNNTIFCGRKIRAELLRSALFDTPNASVRIWDLAPTVTTAEVKCHSGAYLVETNSTPLVFDNKDMEKNLMQIMERKQGFKTYEAIPPNPNKFFAEAQVRFRTWDSAKHTQVYLEDCLSQRGPWQLRFSLPPLQYVITIPLSQYRSQKRRWDLLPIEANGNEDAFVRITDNSTDKAFIRVLGEDKKAVGRLKVRVESLVAGETLEPRLWHRSFMGSAGIRLLDNISARTKTYVRVDWKSKTLKLYADGNAKQAAVDLITAEIERLEGLGWSVSIGRCAIGFFMRKGLPILQEELGEDAVTLELHPTPRLMIRGGEEARQTVERLIDESRVGVKSEIRASGQDACPICFDEVDVPVMLTCGHFYCTACLCHFLSSAVERKSFPLVCSGDKDRCKTPIAIPIIQRYLLQQQFDRLVDMAVTTYIEKQPTKFKYCTTPDCPQVYRCEGGGMVLTCPSCFVTVCSGCHKEAHKGMTCREREIMTNTKEQERLNEEWALASGAKRCPSCRVLIQKTEGCNHMTCRCGVHLCWRCLKTFPNGEGVHIHMNSVHGGIYGDGNHRIQRAPESRTRLIGDGAQATQRMRSRRRVDGAQYPLFVTRLISGGAQATQRVRSRRRVDGVQYARFGTRLISNGAQPAQRAQSQRNRDAHTRHGTPRARLDADLALARRLQAEEDRFGGNTGRIRDRILAHGRTDREPEWPGAFHNAGEQHRQRSADQGGRGREIGEMAQRRVAVNERHSRCIIM